MKIKLPFFAFVLVLFLSSCTMTITPPSQEYTDLIEQTTYLVLNFPHVRFDDVIWQTDGVIVVIQDESVRPLRQPYALEGDNELRYLDLEQDGKCSKVTSYEYPTRLSDGRLGLLKRCATDNAFTSTKYMVAYDWKTGQLEQIVQNPLKSYAISGCFSWNPDMTRGIQAVDNGLTGTLNWLTRMGPEPVRITLRDGDSSWDLAADFEEDGSREGGRISCPAWSPNGDKIAVFVSFDAMGVEGLPRLDKQMQLIFIFPETGDTESVLSGVYYPESIEWSRDGKNIAFSGYVENDLRNYQGNEPKGIWVFNTETRTLLLVAKGGYFKDLSWSPDSKNIAVIWCNDSECSENELRKYTLPN
jgi:WD40 repeat protein